MNQTILESKTHLCFADINALTKSVGWGQQFYQTEEKWQTVLARSTHVASIQDHEKLIAFGRILEDGIMCMFYDICVHPDYQHQQLGTLLMNHLINKIKDKAYLSIGLFVWQGNKTAAQFYNKLGFEQAYAMELKTHMKQFC